ncbi:translation initiation factor IF-2 N-terminal domain-containing protein [Sphingomonas aerolata]
MVHASRRPSRSATLVVPEAITVQEPRHPYGREGADLVKALFKMGMPVTMTQTIDQDTAELLVTEFGHNLTRVSDVDQDLANDTIDDAEETLRPRARSSRSWVTSITARRRCSMPCAAPTWCAAKRVASPSISARIRSR